MSDPKPVSQEEVAYKKKVGKLNGDTLFEVGLVGGLHMIARAKDGKTEILGTGPHRAVARHIAKKRNPDISWSELAKSEQFDEAHFRDVLPFYEGLTDELSKAQE